MMSIIGESLVLTTAVRMLISSDETAQALEIYRERADENRQLDPAPGARGRDRPPGRAG
jgi:hypothetical protein